MISNNVGKRIVFIFYFGYMFNVYNNILLSLGKNTKTCRVGSGFSDQYVLHTIESFDTPES
jgi:hypothetical protein